MEEDIKVLEKFINRCKECKFATCEQCEINWKEVQAIENLIKRYKELEQLNLTEIKMYSDGKIVEKRISLDDYIPKSKVREKIEEYEELVKDFEEYWSKDPRQFKKEKCVDYYKIEALKELLQKGDTNETKM